MADGGKAQRHTERIGWLRAAVLGANDGVLSTSSLVLGVAAAHASHGNVLLAGVAGLVAGGMSMAAGEYVSVHSQKDTEDAEIELERAELKSDNKGEHKELAATYVERGLDPTLAKQVADQVDGPRCAGCACARRVGNLRDGSRASDSGCIGISGEFRGGSGSASGGCSRNSRRNIDPVCSGDFLGTAGLAGRVGGSRGRSAGSFWGTACCVLGRAGDGSDFRSGGFVWENSVKGKRNN